MRIAVVGAGITGLTSAYELHSDHQVVLYDAQHIGGHVNTIDVEAEGKSYAIDTGFIVYNERTYPAFCRMLDDLSVASQPTTMSFSVKCESSGLEYRGADFNGFFAQRKNLLNPRHYRLMLDYLRFGRQATNERLSWSPELTVQEFFTRHRYSAEFRNQFFLPMVSAIWSCPQYKAEQFPIRFLADFYHHHGLLGVRNFPTWRVIQGGSRCYVQALLSRMRHVEIHEYDPVVSVKRRESGVFVATRHGTSEFDHVIFACHSDQALKILGEDATTTEREVLGEFPYETNEAVLHTDERLLPRNRRAWASWNYTIPAAAGTLATNQPHSSIISGAPTQADASGDPTKATVTYNMNILQRLDAPVTFCVTLNSTDCIDPASVLQRIRYQHPIFTKTRAAAQSRHSELINANSTSFCGAYWGNGFHEDGVQSALAVCREVQQVKVVWKVASTKA